MISGIEQLGYQEKLKKLALFTLGRKRLRGGYDRSL